MHCIFAWHAFFQPTFASSVGALKIGHDTHALAVSVAQVLATVRRLADETVLERTGQIVFRVVFVLPKRP